LLRTIIETIISTLPSSQYRSVDVNPHSGLDKSINQDTNEDHMQRLIIDHIRQHNPENEVVLGFPLLTSRGYLVCKKLH
jgi:hypothetical protein